MTPFLLVAGLPWGTPVAAQGEADRAADDRVAGIMAGMSVKEKVGQLFMSRVHGYRAADPSRRAVAANRRDLGVDDAAALVDRYHVGSVVYFGWAGNLQNPGQVARLSNGIQAAAEASGDLPVLISTDQEHGIIDRLGPPATQFPGAMAVGASHDPDLAREAARVTGEELSAVGIRLNLAPVADVNADPANPVIGLRSFGSRSTHVADFVRAQVAGLQEDAGVASTAKHFPGHGDTDVDSHLGLPVIRKSRAEWEAVDAQPFEAAIEAGVDVIMTAHVVVPALDRSRRPATLSRPILTGILREEMGYEGVIMTDSLSMAAVRERFADRRVPVLALQAGADVLADPPNLRLAYAAVYDAVRSGEVPIDRVDASVERILRLKDRLGLLDDAMVDVAAVPADLGTAGHRGVARDVADAGVTVLRDAHDWVPVGRRSSVLLTGWSDAGVRSVAGQLHEDGRRVTTAWTGTRPGNARIEGVVRAARKHDVTIVFVAFASSYPRQRALVRRLLASGRRVVVVEAWSPYDAAWFPRAPAHLVTYGAEAVSIRALAAIVSGEIPAAGRLPVRIPRLGRPDSTLFGFGHGVAD